MNLENNSSAAESSIDWELCLSLANQKKEIAQELLSLVLQQLPLDLQTIQLAFKNNDRDELLRYVHKLHGALCYTGLPHLKKIVSHLEGLLKTKSFDEAKLVLLLNELDHEISKVLESSLPY